MFVYKKNLLVLRPSCASGSCRMEWRTSLILALFCVYGALTGWLQTHLINIFMFAEI